MENFELNPINSKISNRFCIVLFMLALVVSIGAVANKIYKMNYGEQPIHKYLSCKEAANKSQ